MSGSLKYVSLILILCIATNSAQYESCDANNQLDKQCESYTYSVIKPFLRYLKQVRDELDKSELKDREISELKVKLSQLQSKEEQFRANIVEFLQKTVEELTSNWDKELYETLSERNNELAKKKADLEICHEDLSKQIVLNGQLAGTSCVPFVQNEGIRLISVPGIDDFPALCVSTTAGAGWMVIQDRFNGEVDFNRGWAEYRDGFGTSNGEFFMGLEKIYSLTNTQQFELYMQMTDIKGYTKYAHYDHFAIASEDDGYAITSLGVFSGDVEVDALRYHLYQKFSTIDSDNDAVPYLHCARENKAGWWYKDCFMCNFNGRPLDTNIVSNSVACWHHTPLKEARMLIRPKVQ